MFLTKIPFFSKIQIEKKNNDNNFIFHYYQNILLSNCISTFIYNEMIYL